MANLGSLVYKIKSNNRDFKQGMRENQREVKKLDREVKKNQSTLKKYSRGFKRAGIALTAFGAIVTGVSFKLAKMASDANEIQSRFNHVFGEMSKDANEWAESFAESFGQSRSEVKSMMATLQDTLVPMGLAEEKAYDLNKTITQLAIDMSSFANVPLEQAMNDIMSAIVGQSRPMRKYGSVLTENRVKANALKEGIIETDRELTEQEKILSRINLMMQDMTKAQGDYNRTQDSFANQIRETKNDIKNLAESIGQDMLPVFADFLEKARDILQWFKDLPDETKKTIAQWTIWSGIVAGIVGPLALIVGYLPQIVTGLAGIKTVLAGFGPAGWVILGFGTLVGLLGDTKTEVEELEDALNDLTTTEMKARKEMLKTELERFKQKAEQRKEAGTDALDSIASSAVSMGYEQKISDLEQKIKLLENEIYNRENKPEKTGGSTRPGWLGDGTVTGGSEGGSDQKGREISDLMLSGWELDILKTDDPMKKELKRLEMQRKKELARIGQYGVPKEDATALAKDIWEKYELKKQEVIDKYNEMEQQKEEQNADQIASIEKNLTSEIKRSKMSQYEFEKWQLKQQKKEYLEMGVNKEKVTKWYNEQLYQIEAERLNKLKEKYGEDVDNYEEAQKEKYNMYNDPRMKSYREGQIAGQKYEKLLNNDFINMFNRIGYTIDEANDKFQQFRSSLIDGFTKAITEGKNLMDVLTNIADQIAQMVIKKGIVTPIVDWGLEAAGMAHGGGVVTTNGIQSFHSGGQVGSGPLKPDEKLIKTKVGEIILNEDQQKGIANAQNSQPPVIFDISAMDSQDVIRALTKDGGKAVAQALGIDYNRNGKSRSIIKGGK
ncbi:MAG: hypothetical protein K9K76_11400 [Halanaerobiales bacterium]|nr:hypothetical protein [Halanaerobiales bacterium]